MSDPVLEESLIDPMKLLALFDISLLTPIYETPIAAQIILCGVHLVDDDVEIRCGTD